MSTMTKSADLRNHSPRVQGFAVIAAGFGQNVILTTVTTFLLVYLLQYAHISTAGIAVVTTILTVTRVVDAVSDPVMGSIIDMTRTRWGKLRPYILFSAAPVALLTGLLFSVPDADESTQLIFFGIVYVLWGFTYTVCDVPFWALIGSAFPDPAARTRVVSKVRAFGAISLGLATLGMPYLAAALSFGPTTTGAGWSRAVFLIAIIGMSLFILPFFFTRERASTANQPRTSFFALFRGLAQNTPLLMVVLGSFLGFGRNLVQAGGAVFAVIAYGDPFIFTFIGAAIIGGLVISAFFTPLLLRRWSARALIIGSSVVGSVLYLALYLVGYQSLVGMIVFIFLTGLTLGIFLVLQATMIADAVDDAEHRTGVRNDGVSFATLTFVSKIMSAVAVLVFGLFIVIAGYQDGVKVTAAMTNTVFVSITIIPAVSCLLSAVPFVFYRLGRRATATADTNVPA